MKVTYEHIIDAPLATVLDAYASEEFYIEKSKNSGAIDVKILEREELPGGKLRMKARIKEPSRVPAFLRKNETDVYDDDNVLDREKGVMTWKVTLKSWPTNSFVWFSGISRPGRQNSRSFISQLS